MKANELFSLIQSSSYITLGDDVDFLIKYIPEEKKIYCLFQCSSQKRDWINNFNFPAKLYYQQENKFLVARGWGNAWKTCNDEVMHRLFVACDVYKCYDVIFSGWSYGGAIAQIAAEDFYYRTSHKSDVITFGSPKPLFSFKTKKYFNSCVNSVINYSYINDFVPLLPPFPFYFCMKKKILGKKFKIKEFINPNFSHCCYGDANLYV
ncbi:MAG: hypothetical protein MJ174_07380 [Treponema sp.]|nr:hypothetical protein [Treponema sp.]